ncbi:hypothetical protein [Cochlodiniinecator piscidefendens]|uniref:hypothetical protein n=1 Tax=Cochlodiniinecator piscidefendens TaxID=2715756 RepID=UPI00140B8108|nr:hypothetical protein [Cochlodiniinecator piscidefendens]
MKNYLPKLVLSAAITLSGVFVSTTAMAYSDGCNGLSGYYGASTAIVVSENPISGNMYGISLVRVSLNLPNAYGTCEGNRTTLHIPADNNNGAYTLEGTFNSENNSVSWTDNTTWTKQFLTQ